MKETAGQINKVAVAGFEEGQDSMWYDEVKMAQFIGGK